jgi:hypothetical protein
MDEGLGGDDRMVGLDLTPVEVKAAVDKPRRIVIGARALKPTFLCEPEGDPASCSA